MRVSEVGGRCGDEPGERLDQFAGLIEILVLLAVLGQPAAQCSCTHQVNRYGGDHLNGADLGHIACC